MSDTEHTEDLGKRMHKPTEKSLVSFQSKCLKYQQHIEKTMEYCGRYNPEYTR